MLCSAISRISRLATHGRKNHQYIRTLNRTEYRPETCGFTSYCVQNLQTNFGTDGTVTSIVNSKNPVCDVGLSRFHILATMMSQQIRTFSSSQWRHKKEEITVNFLNRDGETFTVKGKVGETLLDVVIDNDVDIDGFGACEGTLACSTCHLLFDDDIFEILPEKLDEEEDMLDLAYGLEDTSRLGCQISLTKEMDNMIVRVPEGINDARDV